MTLSKINKYNSLNSKEFEIEFAEHLVHLDIYYQPSFLACDAKMQGGEYEIFTVKDGSKVWIYPYIILPIQQTSLFDLTSPYGYCGPYCNDLTLFRSAEQEFLKYISTKKIVTEFVRYHFHYNSKDESRFSAHIQNIENRTVVLLDTTKSTTEIWENSFSGKNRNLIRKLEKEQFEWKIKDFELEDLPSFLEIYSKTMLHANASEFYFFDEDFFKNLINTFKVKIVFVIKEDIIYSASLFFVCGGFVTYYLSGRNLNFPKVNATNFLLGNMVFWATKNGYKHFNLGGGLSNDPDDSLYKFKRNFSENTAPFYIGKRIHLQKEYELIQENFIHTFGQEKFDQVKHILQFYRN